ncbi:MAG: oligosaccharide flippase family protein, partial [Anaerolineae bacterium]|nr:oligosaccharide flippase family protein [Anaerolineae bacterium]
MMDKVLGFHRSLFQMMRIGLKSTVARNAASLYLIQFANYIVPLIQVPYLVRVLGPAGYGAVAFAQSFISYLSLFVEYGFDWSATRKISVQRHDVQSVNRIALHVWAAKFLLGVVGLVVLIVLALVVPKLREVLWLLLALYGLVLGNVLFPTWLFQGMERMVAISVINLGMRVGVLGGVFLLVKKPEHAVMYAGLMGAGAIAAGATGMIGAVRMFGLRLSRISWTGIWEVLREGWVLFLSKASVSLYTAGNAFILGMLTNHTVVGYYSAAEKVVKSVLGLIGPISQAAYPRFSKLAAESRKQTLVWGLRLLMIMGLAGSLLMTTVLLCAPFLSALLLGPQFALSTEVMRILAPIIFLIALNNTMGVQMLFPLHYDRFVFKTVLMAGCFNVLL